MKAKKKEEVGAAECDKCRHFGFHNRKVSCDLGHRPMFYLPADGRDAGYKAKCGEFEKGGEG